MLNVFFFLKKRNVYGMTNTDSFIFQNKPQKQFQDKMYIYAVTFYWRLHIVILTVLSPSSAIEMEMKYIVVSGNGYEIIVIVIICYYIMLNFRIKTSRIWYVVFIIFSNY